MQKTVRSHGADLWARRDGSPEAPCILLVAGANASHLRWPQEFWDLLVSRGYCVIRYDDRDTGRSSGFDFARPPYTLHDLAEDIVAVLDGFEVKAAHVVGLSMGGTLVQEAVLDHPERFLSATVMLTAALAAPIPLARGKELSAVRIPFLVIQGGQDPLNPPPHGRHIAELIPSARYVEIDELGHALPGSVHAVVVEEICRHIGER